MEEYSWTLPYFAIPLVGCPCQTGEFLQASIISGWENRFPCHASRASGRTYMVKFMVKPGLLDRFQAVNLTTLYVEEGDLIELPRRAV
jgi:hypothetical protein